MQCLLNILKYELLSANGKALLTTLHQRDYSARCWNEKRLDSLSGKSELRDRAAKGVKPNLETNLCTELGWKFPFATTIVRYCNTTALHRAYPDQKRDMTIRRGLRRDL